MMTDIHTLAGPYALDSVNDIERAAFSRHIAECESCAFEVSELREVTARLADGAWAVPPPRLRDQVFARVRSTRQLPPGRAVHPGSAGPRRWPRRLAAAAAAVVLAAGVGVGTYGVQERRVHDEQVAAEAARADAARAEAERAQGARIEAVLAAPDARLSYDTPRKGGRVAVVVSERLNAGVAVMTNLPDPGSGKTYQMWTVRGGDQPKSAGLLPAEASRSSQLIENMRGIGSFGLSIEPEGGS
jgi:anti-sigma-K factor RskA